MSSNLFARFAAKSGSAQSKVASSATAGASASQRTRDRTESPQSSLKQPKLEEEDDIVIVEPPRKRLKVDTEIGSVRVRVKLSTGVWKEAHLTESEGNVKIRLIDSTNQTAEQNLCSLKYIKLAEWEDVECYNRGAPGTPDHLDFDLKLTIIGFNPGNKSGAARMHYANPQNHFWPLMREVGFVPHEFGPADDLRLSEEPYRIGFTNIVSRITPSSADLKKEDYNEGAQVLRIKLQHFRPRIICFNGKGVFIPFVATFDRQLSRELEKKMKFGKQDIHVPGMPDNTIIFCMPSTSGRVSGYQKADKKKLFEELKILYNSV
eukprot:TRINITY_DN937_c0_g2_i1.p1 TRINITY_DN937_c0_g2~~TRINITY_DN937_c0_g2_i1.p1  ORF type:complete len:320 (+),score=54.46 TRINITY_DN937_c0_g2_i1:98-1057(+)